MALSSHPAYSVPVQEADGDCCMAEAAQDLFCPFVRSDRSSCITCCAAVRF